MNRLRFLRFYLVGPIDRVEGRGVEWRNDLSEWLLNKNAIPLNPCNKPIGNNLIESPEMVDRRKKLREEGFYDELSFVGKREIRGVDLRMVDHSDCLIVNLDLDAQPCGTWEEIFWANRQKKPVVIRCPQGKKNIPEWLFYTLPHQMFFETWDEVKDYLNHIDLDKEIETHNRWVFFDMESLIRKIISNIDKE